MSVPSYAIVKGCGIQCKNLPNAYDCIRDGKNDKPERVFRHVIVDEYASQYHKQDAAFLMRHCDFMKLTNDMGIGQIPYEGSDLDIKGNGAWVKMLFWLAGTYQGFLCWVEYGLRTHAADKIGGSSHCDNTG